jgi:ATPase subunit of ABC transporter with duplicated ATPase domains
MFEIKNMNIIVNDKYIIKDFNLTLNEKDKLAIIGEEGNGKSTLLKSILGIAPYAEITGNINTHGNRIGYLEQSINKDDLLKNVYDYLFNNQEDYYNKVNNLYKLLDLFKFNDSILEQDINTLSGGEKVKISLLRIMLEEYDILFLDEPTNDLDIETLEWLEDFIIKCDKPIVYVSHDETLLSKTANMILHLELLKKKTECKHTLLKIDYDTYVDKRIRSIEQQTREAHSERREFTKKMDKYMQIMQKVEHQQNTISRKDPHGAKMLKKKMHSLKVQEKKLDNMELTEVPDVEESINFFFNDASIPRNKKIYELSNYQLKIDNKILSNNINLSIIGNTHMCIIGKNGCGKSTLIKHIYEELKNRDDIRLGYMPQTYDDILNKYDTVLDFLVEGKNQDDITKARMYLGDMNFTRDEMTGKISDISNGTKAKLFLIKLVLNNCNVLILDEPTRNVSPLSNPVIRRVLRDFNGTIISVSHDRKYLSEVIDEIYLLDINGLTKQD